MPTSSSHRRSALRTVDPLAARCDSATIYEDENGIVWHFMLNFTDLGFGTYGNNKFYMVQLIQDNANYYVFRKWGRVGAKNPQKALETYTRSLDKAKASFTKKFNDKSENEWPLDAASGFEKVPGKYVLVELNDEEPEQQEDGDEEEKEGASAMEEDENESVPLVPSKLPEQVQEMIQLICDADLIEKEVASMKLDLKRLPLGRLSKAQISQGYALLEKMSKTVAEISKLTKQNEPEDEQATPAEGGRSRRPRRAAAVASGSGAQARAKRLRVLKGELKELSNAFYSLIPHDFGRQLPPLIESLDEIKLKIDLLEVLADIEISQKLQKEKRNASRRSTDKDQEEDANHPLDAQYKMLQVEMEPLAESDAAFQVIQQYVETTHAPTHVQYKLQIRSVLKIHRNEEDAFAETLQAVPNHQLLWHGSRLCNLVGILAKGLRVAPPEAPSNGYMFGKGIYFADSVSKSANYCWTTPDQPRGVLVLAQVALGKPLAALEAQDLSYDALQTEAPKTQYDSLHGLGKMASPPEGHVTMDDGVVVPVGELEPTGVANGELLYNEFVVYRREQVKLRYLVAVDFIYTDCDL